MKSPLPGLAIALSLCIPPLAQSRPSEPSGADLELPPALLALQPQAQSFSAKTPDGATVELVDLNPSVGRWILLRAPDGSGTPRWAHLDLGQEGVSRARLDRDGNLRVDYPKGKPVVCRLDTPQARAAVVKSYNSPFTALCDGAIFARSRPSHGYKSDLESVTDWLRSQGPLGEQLITWRKDLFPPSGDTPEETSAPSAPGSSGGPPAAVLQRSAPSSIATANLGLRTGYSSIAPGSWAQVQGAPGVWASIAAPDMAPNLFSRQGHEASDSLAYFMAIETNLHDPRYSVGVEHPSVGWSSRAPGPHPGSGPDGVGSLDPLDRVGMVPPWAMQQLTAVIAGGFKRDHSAFREGPLAGKNHGSHYGFVEAGVVLSKLHPGVATFLQRAGEAPQIKVWTEQDEARGVDKLLFARQNGLPLIDEGRPGANLAIGPGGNWSGNAQGAAETVRSSLCVAESGKRSFLIYGVFTKAIPRDMAQLLSAYGCKSAMQLDMNAPALTYAAVATRDERGQVRYQSLMGSMNDKNFGGTARFTNIPDSRDFIYFVRH